MIESSKQVMSGHSKWSTIKRAKGAADQKRGMTFTKIANAITIATKAGSTGDPESSPRLRLAIDQARSVNMPKDNISRAIDRGLGKLPGQQLEEVNFEAFGPFRVAYLIEGVTDNKLRTLQEIKNLFERNGGVLAHPGALLYMFEKIGQIKIKGKGGNEEDEILELIDLGAMDVEQFEEEGINKYVVETEPTILSDVSNKIREAGYVIESTEIFFKPNITVQIQDKETAEKVLDFTEKLENNDDIQKVYANYDISEDLL